MYSNTKNWKVWRMFSVCCAIFSWIAILVLLSFAFLLDTSPEYVKHISDRGSAREATYQAAGLYALTFTASCIMWLYSNSYKRGIETIESRRISIVNRIEVENEEFKDYNEIE